MHIAKYDKKKKIFTVTYDSVADYLRQVEHGDIVEPGMSKRGDIGDSWSGELDLSGACQLQRHGWPTGLRQLSDALATAKAHVARSPAIMYDVAGAYPAAHLAAAGDPASMVALQPSMERHKPVIKLGVAGNMTARFSADQFQIYGAALVSYIDTLENTGCRIELYKLMSNTYSDGGHMTTQVRLKAAEQPLELDRLAATLIHPASFRMVEFHHMSTLPIARQIGFGYGSSVTARRGIDVEGDMLLMPAIDSLPGMALESVDQVIKALAPIMEEQLTGIGAEPPAFEFSAAA